MEEDMEGIRVNRITVNVDTKSNDTTISLYRTNQLLGALTDDQLHIESFNEAGVSVKAYQMYCRDIVINLIDNGGIKGFYYEPKSESVAVKYTIGNLMKKCEEYVQTIIGETYEFQMTQNNIEHMVDRYKDKYIKDATVDFEVLLKQYNIRFKVRMEIKSGQACRPRIFIYNGTELNFNITNINKIVRSNS
jgi:hypothetical protein